MPAIQIIPENADFEPSLRDLSPNQHGRLGPPKFSNKSPPTTDNSFAVDRLGKAACSGAVSIREVVPTWIRTSILRPSLRSTGCLSEEAKRSRQPMLPAWVGVRRPRLNAIPKSPRSACLFAWPLPTTPDRTARMCSPRRRSADDRNCNLNWRVTASPCRRARTRSIPTSL